MMCSLPARRYRAIAHRRQAALGILIPGPAAVNDVQNAFSTTPSRSLSSRCARAPRRGEAPPGGTASRRLFNLRS
jgi:hypothetical protein